MAVHNGERIVKIWRRKVYYQGGSYRLTIPPPVALAILRENPDGDVEIILTNRNVYILPAKRRGEG